MILHKYFRRPKTFSLLDVNKILNKYLLCDKQVHLTKVYLSHCKVHVKINKISYRNPLSKLDSKYLPLNKKNWKLQRIDLDLVESNFFEWKWMKPKKRQSPHFFLFKVRCFSAYTTTCSSVCKPFLRLISFMSLCALPAASEGWESSSSSSTTGGERGSPSITCN